MRGIPEKRLTLAAYDKEKGFVRENYRYLALGLGTYDYKVVNLETGKATDSGQIKITSRMDKSSHFPMTEEWLDFAYGVRPK